MTPNQGNFHGVLAGKGKIAPFRIVYGCTNQGAINWNKYANQNDDSCIFASGNVVFDTAAQKAVGTKSGACLFQSYDVPYLAGWTDEGIDLGFGAYFITFASMSNGNATIFTDFITATGAEVGLYLPIIGFAPAFVYADWAVGKFNPTGIALDQESELGNKEAAWVASLTPAEQSVVDAVVAAGGTIDDGLQLVYISRSRSTMARYPSLKAWWDVPDIWTVAPNKQPRKNAIRPLADTPYMKQYEHISPDSVAWISGNHTYNLSLINEYCNTLLPGYLNNIFVTPGTKFPNITKLVVEQRLAHESGTAALSAAENNILISMVTEKTLANTERYDSVFWMRFAEIVRPNGVALGLYDAHKRMNKCYKFAYTFPVSLPYNGVSGQGFSDGADSFSMLATNQSGSDIVIQASDLVIPGKTISGDFTYDRGWSSSLGGSVNNETGTEAVITLKRNGNGLFSFGTT